MRTTTLRCIVIVTICVGLAACGTGTPSAAPSTTAAPAAHVTKVQPTTTTTVPNPGQQVLADINSGNAAVDRDKNANPPNYSTIAGDFSTTAHQLVSLKYPADAQADAAALEAILNKLAYDVAEVPSAGEAEASIVLNDEGTERADSAALRSVLGLPPPAT